MRHYTFRSFSILYHTFLMFRNMFFHSVGEDFWGGAMAGNPYPKRGSYGPREILWHRHELQVRVPGACHACHGMACVMSCLPLLKFSSTEVEHGLIYHGNCSIEMTADR